ncbi:MAG TPA: MBL fold metallo-hydrolase, partial [Gemmatimonadaceae bacterium]|nr:MBL fold metallo-hydrolase [Gemmatimonadaceae bacterium]
MRPTLATLLVLALLASPRPAATQDVFSFKRVTPTVYLATPTRVPWGAISNATIVILDDGVLVVDSHSRPSIAKALVSELRRVTDKPVRYVVDSHFHWDHAQGNQAYMATWPAGAEIIASEATRFNLEHIGVARVKADIAMLPDSVALWRRQLATVADSAARRRLRDQADEAERYVNEIRTMELSLPTLTFERSLAIRRGATTVNIHFLGRGHTDGDVVVHLPEQRIVATGDLLHAWAPFMWDAYPYDWIRTLVELEKLDFDQVLSGHGDVMQGKGQLRLWREYLSELMREVEVEVGRGRTRLETIQAVAPRLHARFASRFPAAALDGTMEMSIEKAWNVVGLPA